MVCGKCQKLNKTTLATPGVKKKSEMYYGSSTSSSGQKKSATLGQTGVSKVNTSSPFPLGKLYAFANIALEQTPLQSGTEPLRAIREHLYAL